MPGDSDSPSDPARSIEDRLAAIEAVVRTGEVYARRLAITDEAGQERIVGEVAAGHVDLRVMVAGAGPARRSLASLTAGPDPDFGAALGLHLFAGGEELVALGVWQDGTESWRATFSGVQPAAGTSE